MEKERFFCGQGHLQPVLEMNCQQSDQLLPPCFLNLNWDQSMEQSSHFGSALSSIVSSPSNQAPSVTDTTSCSAIMGELIGRLGSICNSGEISSQPHQFLGGGNNNSNTTSCYTTPLNSPPKLNRSTQANLPISGNMPPPPAAQLPPFSTDPGFQERAAMFSCFGGQNYTQAFGAGGTHASGPDVPMQDRLPLGMEARPKVGTVPARSVTLEESSVSDHTVICSGSNTRKRKAAQKGRAKDAPLTPISKDLPKVAEEESLNAKKTKSSETASAGNDDVKLKAEPTSSTNSGGGEQKPEKERNPKPAEPPKQDYIHVRARRGQATDSHSLAERVRREKISERMKFLQDLVPGCNKVTGKAVMLDEIINYVQSLQRQVEFLSMKLATVNPRMDLNMENLLHKDMHQSRGCLLSSGFPTEISAPAFTFAPHPPHSTPHQNIVTGSLENHCPVNSLESAVRKTVCMQLPSLDGFGDFSSQASVFWDGDLQNVVQMGLGQNQESVSSTAFHGALPTASAHMKIEL